MTATRPTQEELQALGLQKIAYLKHVEVNGTPFIGVHAADGTPLTCIEKLEVAKATVRSYDMEPLSVH